MKREIDAPGHDWLTEEEAVQYLRLNLVVFRELEDAGFFAGIRRLSRQCVLYHWKGLVAAQWRLELGDVPELAQIRRKAAKTRERPAKPGETGRKTCNDSEAG